MNYENWIIQWFRSHTDFSEEEIRSHMDENYFDLGYVDSFGFIELISEIEDLGIELANDQFEDREFSTIRGLIAVLEERGVC